MQVIGVVGSGAMGAGIAQVALTAGLEVILYDLDQAALQRAGAGIEARLRRLVEKGQLGEAAAVDAMDSLVLAADLSNLAPAEAAIEAIVERLEPKQALFAKLEEIVAPDAILATNTSSLWVAAIAARCRHPERVCGLHFFNPVPLMKLVEVIVAPATSEAVAEKATALALQLARTPVRVRDGPGFLVNLAGRAYVTEALQIVQEGVADVATVDRIMRDGAGFRMGPFELMDLTGIDVNFPATTTIFEGYQHDPRLRTTTLHESMFNAGRFGRKTGRGYHDYGDGAPPGAAEPSPSQGEPGPFAARIAGGDEGPGWATLRELGLQEDGDINFIAPVGEDAASACHWLSLDPATTVAVDFTGLERRHLTLMTAPGGGAAAERAAAWLRGHGYRVETIRDSPGFVLQRILAMVANLGCELAQIGVGTPGDIDTAMRLAQNYPKGPLEWAAHLGAGRVHDILRNLQSITGSDRYRPSLWLRRRALLGLPIHLAD
jgi:3-hydroxybutyryl-CoA dehydrogenase